MVALQVMREVPLPAPEPEIEPGEMLVGIKACLESGADLTHEYSEQTILGPIAIGAAGELTVDWGDGTARRTVRRSGHTVARFWCLTSTRTAAATTWS